MKSIIEKSPEEDLSEFADAAINQCIYQAHPLLRSLPGKDIMLIAPNYIIEHFSRRHLEMRFVGPNQLNKYDNSSFLSGIRLMNGYENKIIMYHYKFVESKDERLISILEIQ